jgi:amidase
MHDLTWLDATALADLVRRGEVSARELALAAIARIEATNPRINAVVTPLFERALERAEQPLEGPFAGVPFLLKDLGATLAGAPYYGGSRWAAACKFVAPRSSELVLRQERAGLVILGKTSTPELGLPPTTEPRLFGPTHNPWDVTRTPGGSSGGSAAAVASGMVPMAHANDGGGSIRIPASCCGLVGLKPTRGRNPMGPDRGDVMNGLVCEHAVTRSVRDSAALLDATAGPDVGDPYFAPPQARPYAQDVGAEPGRLRIALTTRSLTGTAVHPDCVAAAVAAAKLCEQLGHVVEEAAPEVDGETLSRPFIVVFAAGAAQGLYEWRQVLGRDPDEDELEPLTRAFAGLGQHTHSGEYLAAVAHLQRVSRTIARFMQQHDVWLTPTLGEPPIPLGTLDPRPDNPLWGIMRAAEFVPFTPLFNVTGQPAMSLPLHWNEAGLPVGVQLAGRFGDEATLFRLAAQLEAARPWRDRHPPLV